jgi:uncharacterized repeat protein (TIGR03803 family)
VNLNRLPILSALPIIILSLTIPASAEWKEQVLYSFQGGSDAATPAGGVVFDTQGNLYGAAQGGAQGEGTVFQLVPPQQQGGAWTESVLYSFQGKAENDGGIPEGGLIIDGIGNLYGVTAYGGSGGCILAGSSVGCGTVYEISPPKQKGGQWTEAILYSFKGGKDGYVPNGNLVFDKAGNLYGVTVFGGGYGSCDSFYPYCGTIFKLSPPKRNSGKWTERVLHSFKGGSDVSFPNGGLVLDRKGVLYGTSFAGGGTACNSRGFSGCGTVFELNPPTKKGSGWTGRIIHRFQGGDDGDNPAAGLIFDRDGRLYGTTLTGGPGGGGGTVFRLTPPSNHSGDWKKAVLYGFNGTGGGLDAESPVIFDSTGNIYGTTLDSGGAYYGTVFRLTPPKQKGSGWTGNLLYGFQGPPDGGQPSAGLIFDKKGNLYSTTTQGGSGTGCGFHGCGTVFEVSP